MRKADHLDLTQFKVVLQTLSVPSEVKAILNLCVFRCQEKLHFIGVVGVTALQMLCETQQCVQGVCSEISESMQM